MSESLVKEYLDNEAIISEIQARQKDIKTQLWADLVGSTAQDAGTKWEYDGVGSVTFVKGRTSSKLDPKLLIRNGVTAAVIERCTKTTTGLPSLRIERAK